MAYKSGADEEDDVYIYGNMVTSPDAHWKKSSDKIRLGEKLPNLNRKGFADLKKATLYDKNGKTTVVAKMCKGNNISFSDFELLLSWFVNKMN